MKLVIFLIALIALAIAAPVDDKKPAEDKTVAEKTEAKQPAADDIKKEEKPEEKNDEEHKGLKWPLPDPDNEGDLMLYGSHLFDRVDKLYKSESKNDMEKMIFSVGRDYLRRVYDYIKKTPEFTILPILCRDSDHLNSTERWQIRVRPRKQNRSFGGGLGSCDSTDQQPEIQSTQNIEQIPIVKRDSTPKKNTKQNDPIVPSNSSTTENATEIAPIEVGPNFEVVRKENNQRMGDNFARLLLKSYSQEKLEKEESDYLNRWSSEESIHYGLMGIYCHHGENVEEISKRISAYIDQKQ